MLINIFYLLYVTVAGIDMGVRNTADLTVASGFDLVVAKLHGSNKKKTKHTQISTRTEHIKCT